MIAYYLLTMISRAFSSMPGLAGGIARDIRDGDVKKFLIQPIDMLGFLLLYRVAHKLVYYVVAAAPFALVFYLCRGYFRRLARRPDVRWPSWPSLVMSFLLGFFLEATLGMFGFWFLEVNSLLFVYMLLSFFFSGHMFPIDMLPGVWGTIVKQMPLQYLAYFPAAVFLGKVDGLGAVDRPGHGVRLGGVLHDRQPRGLPSRHAALQRLWRMNRRRWPTGLHSCHYFRVSHLRPQ